MFANIQRAQFHPEHSEEVIRVAEESLDTFRGMPGFQGVTYLYDRVTGWGVAVSRWASAADAVASAERQAPIGAQFAPYSVREGVHDVIGPLPVFEVIAEA